MAFEGETNHLWIPEVFYCHHVENFLKKKRKTVFPDKIWFFLPLAKLKESNSVLHLYRASPGASNVITSGKYSTVLSTFCFCPIETVLFVGIAELDKIVTAWVCLLFLIFHYRFLSLVCRSIQALNINAISLHAAMLQRKTVLQQGVTNPIT